MSFGGHWGFQYYMQSFGLRPYDPHNFDLAAGNIVILPRQNSNVAKLASRDIASRQIFEVPIGAGAATTEVSMGAGFYSDLWGPVPYVFGPVPPQDYEIVETRKQSGANGN